MVAGLVSVFLAWVAYEAMTSAPPVKHVGFTGYELRDMWLEIAFPDESDDGPMETIARDAWIKQGIKRARGKMFW